MTAANDEWKRDYLVTVCDECLCASCWHGIFYCSKSRRAGTKDVLASVLRSMSRENASYFAPAEILKHTGTVRYTHA